ncbi:MAG: serpin family protein [Candidatus Neomarinimicrobiota bacterium]|jgi:serpin B|nr:serpin family protein [Candidatus Neomarinimicrobiota bacterium]MDD3965882.1 serpin family protein [Candidatus Neomarinimicrobiota bacterium]MDX9780946.1 serpin family protein [bacterium]
MKKLPVILFAVLIFCISCSKKELAAIDDKNTETLNEAEIISGINQFGFNVLHLLPEDDIQNLFFSPFSISSALAMAYAGAAGNTADEMRKVLYFGQPNSSFHQCFGTLSAALQYSGDEDLKVSIANAIWVEDQYKLLKPYQQLIRDYYKSEAKEMDFIGAPEASRLLINQWVSEQTNDRIKDLLPSGSVDALTRLILTNAVYFNAEWDEHFNEDMTKKAFFYPETGDAYQVDMMYKRQHYPYYETKDFQILEIDYKGKRYAMMLVLPREKGKMTELLPHLDREMLADYDSLKKTEDVILYLPKFRLETRYEMSSILQEMGMAEAFSGQANFSGISGKKDLMISEVIHKAFIEIDEKKTEAAAATGVVMRLTAMPPVPRAPITFRADHPFLFLIREKHTAAILFMGCLGAPEPE